MNTTQPQPRRRMRTVGIQKFGEDIQRNANDAVNGKSPFKVKLDNGKYFVVVSDEAWEQEQETLAVLLNDDLLKQIAESMKTHTKAR